MYGNNHVLVLAIVEDELATLRSGRTLTYEGLRMLTKDVVVMYGKDKPDVLRQLRAGGVAVTEEMASKYLAGERTDHPIKPS